MSLTKVTYSMINSAPANVRDFGAVGNGVTDDTAAVQAALNSGAKRVYAPSGTYLIGAITISSNIEFYGDGINATIFYAKPNVGTNLISNTNTLSGAANSYIYLHDFQINGNSANNPIPAPFAIQTACLYLRNITNCIVERIFATNCVDWGIAVGDANYFTLRSCTVTNIIGLDSSVAVRSGVIMGVAGFDVYNVVVDGCIVEGISNRYVDGFIFGDGRGVVITNCTVKNVPYTGIKCGASNVIISNNYVENCLTGFQIQGLPSNVTFTGNTAYRNAGAGFSFNVQSGDSYNWIVTGNQSVENGQNTYQVLYGAPSGNRFGFWFGFITANTLDKVTFVSNSSVDNQLVPTQEAGIYFSGSGSVTNALISSNTLLGNSLGAFINTGPLDETTALFGLNNSTLNGNKVYPATASHALNFYEDAITAGTSGTMGDGMADRGYVMPKDGYLSSQSIRSTSAVTAGNIVASPRKNGSPYASSVTLSSGTFATAVETPRVQTFVAGDIIYCNFIGSAGLLPSGTANIDVVLQVVYN